MSGESRKEFERDRFGTAGPYKTDNKLAEVEHWLIYFEDKSAGTEIFTDEKSARARFAHLQLSWACHLFASLPVISRLLDAAYADALRAAAQMICCFCDEGIPRDEIGHHIGDRHCYAHAIFALVPERARLKHELEVARARLADLEAKLAVLEKK